MLNKAEMQILDLLRIGQFEISADVTSNEIHGDFIAALLLGRPALLRADQVIALETVALGQGVRLRGFVIKGGIDLRNSHGVEGAVPSLELFDCVVQGQMCLDGGCFRKLRLRNTRFSKLSCREATIETGLLVEGASASDESGACFIDLHGATIRGDCGFARSRLKLPDLEAEEDDGRRPARYALNLSAAHVNGHLMLEPGFEADGGVDIGDAAIEMNIWARGGQFIARNHYGFRCQSTSVHGAFVARAFEEVGEELIQTRVTGGMWLFGAKITGGLYLQGISITPDKTGSSLSLGSASIGGDLDLGAYLADAAGPIRTDLRGDLSMLQVKIGGQVRFSGASIHSEQDAYAIVADDCTIGRGLHFGATEFGRLSDAEEAELGPALYFEAAGPISFQRLSLVGDLILSWAKINGSADFDASKIGGKFVAGRMSIKGATYCLALQQTLIEGDCMIWALLCADEGDIVGPVALGGSRIGGDLVIAGNFKTGDFSNQCVNAGGVQVSGNAAVSGRSNGIVDLQKLACESLSLGLEYIPDYELFARLADLSHASRKFVNEVNRQAGVKGDLLSVFGAGLAPALALGAATDIAMLNLQEVQARREIKVHFMKVEDWHDDDPDPEKYEDVALEKQWRKTVRRVPFRPLVDLSGARTRTLNDLHGHGWGNRLRLRLDGFTFERMGELPGSAHTQQLALMRLTPWYLMPLTLLIGTSAALIVAFIRLLLLPFGWLGYVFSQVRSGVRAALWLDDSYVPRTRPQGLFQGVRQGEDRWKARRVWLSYQYARYRPALIEYDPAPFDQLARVFRSHAQYGDANGITAHKISIEADLVAKRLWFPVSWLFRIAQFGFWAGFRYGLSTSRALISVLVLMIIGGLGVQFANSRGLMVVDATPAATVVSADGGVGFLASPVGGATATCGEEIVPLIYAADVFVPLVDLRQEGRCQFRSSNTIAWPSVDIGSPESWEAAVAHVFAAPVVWHWLKATYAALGWVVMSLVILTISGTLRRQSEGQSAP